jgi:GTPase SAR1 family protein
MQFYHLDQLFQNEYVVTIQLNDPPGQERFEAATNHFFRQCHGVLLLADTSRMDTLERLEKYWFSKLEKLSMDHVQTMLVCTKMDLLEQESEEFRQTFFQQAERFAVSHQMPVFQVSAYRGDNVEHIFKQLIIRIMSNKNLVDELISKATIRKNFTQQESNRSSRRDTFALDSTNTQKGQERMTRKTLKCCK